MKTSKSKYRAAAEFDLERYGLFFPLLEAVPHDERIGAIVKGDNGLPIRRSSFGKWFRQIARAAGIPDDVWNMDTRAGGATEAEEAGVEIAAIQDALTHSRKDSTLRYIRRRTSKIAFVADARERKRAADSDSGERQ
jgi:integrase